jgi:hypothetical protein
MSGAFVDELTEDVVRRLVGEGAFARGAAYVRAGRVVRAMVNESDGVVAAAVQGGAPAPYQLLIRAERDRGQVLLRGVCTCPVGEDCKHVAAALLSVLEARRGKPRGRSSAAPWEKPFAELFKAQAADARSEGEPVGLRFEVVGGPPPRRYPGARSRQVEAPPRVRIRPVVPGRAGKWVVTGVSWQDFTFPQPWRSRGEAPAPIHREQLARRRRRHRGY